MNRRNFIKSVALAGFVSIFVPKLTYHFKWKTQPRFLINPDWVDADYEVKFLFNKDSKLVIPIILRRGSKENLDVELEKLDMKCIINTQVRFNHLPGDFPIPVLKYLEPS